MFLAENSIIPSDEWHHDSKLQNNNRDTVAMLLSKNKIIPSNNW